MPLLYSWGSIQFWKRSTVNSAPPERLLAHHDDIYAVTLDPEWVGPIYVAMQNELWVHSRVRIDGGTTQVWNAAGQKPGVCDAMDQVARGLNPEAKVWRGPELPTQKQGMKVLGTPLGHPDSVAAQLQKILEKQRREGGARVTTNILVRDMDVARPNPLDMRRLEVVADGLPLFGGRQSGTKRASDPRFAMLWRGQGERSTQQQQCGEGRCCQPTDKASNCWGRRWAIPTSLPGTSGPSRKSIKSFCNEFHE